MSCYDCTNDFSGSLYDTGAASAPPSEQSTAVVPASAAPSSAAPDSSGFVEAVEVIANPLKLVETAVDPTDTKLPWGLAVLGACVVLVILANSLDKGGRG
jgi:hypothetical protein